MAWIILFFSAVLEAVWATALGYSYGFTQPAPTVIFIVALIGSMIGLAFAAKTIPMGTAYAIWTGLGAALTVIYAIITSAEYASPLKLMFIGLIIASAVGLKFVPQGSTRPPTR